MDKKSIVIKEIDPNTKHQYQVLSDDFALIDVYHDLLKDALNIVDAMFYYTNPLLFVIVRDKDEFDTKNCGNLWGNYYLTNINTEFHIDTIYSILLVNEVFVQRMGEISIVGTEDFNNVKEYMEKGLHIISIVPDHFYERSSE